MTTRPDQDGWRRLSARMLLIHPLRSVRQLLPALVPILVVGNSGDSGSWPGELVNLAALVLVVAATLVRWFTTRYRIIDDQVQLQHGLLNRQTLTARLDRVRTVDIESSLLHRVLGLTKVQVGTGAQERGEGIVLDGLGAVEAEQLRVSLMHRARAARTLGTTGTATADAAPTADRRTVAVAAGDEPATEVPLVRFSPSWVAYAPLSTMGLLSAFVLWGFVGQGLDVLGLSDTAEHEAESRLASVGVVTIVVGALVFFVVASIVGGIVTYVLAYWGHTVLRHGAGTLRVTRGLLTTRSTTLEERRLRGVSLREPLPIRLACGATLTGIVTGSRGGDADSRKSSSALLPATPRRVGLALAADVLGTAEPLARPLRRHGARATRRRWLRAAQGAGLVVAANLAGWHWAHLPAWSLAPAALALLSIPPLAVDRARSLGHALTEDHLVVREGSLTRVTNVVELDGVIGWDLAQTIFQRRVGLATLTALTASGAGGYRVLDIPVERAYEIVRATSRRIGA